MAPLPTLWNHFGSQKHLAPIVGTITGTTRSSQDGTGGRKSLSLDCSVGPKWVAPIRFPIAIGARSHSVGGRRD
jgi:hypothetical protein